ncbi:hypothetical protein [Leptospira noguchii]|uniref:hypothetical protein n=1 Tax=Leptospira noguchii TaxID=28182 RepID=UPI0018DEE421|nr:hypothetical protein [Leptospira noguchii]
MSFLASNSRYSELVPKPAERCIEFPEVKRFSSRATCRATHRERCIEFPEVRRL